MKIEELSYQDLDHWVAEALGGKRDGRYYDFQGGESVLVTDWHPHSNVKQGHDLIEKFKISLVYTYESETAGFWVANEALLSGKAKGETALIAAARAIVLNAFPSEFL